MSGIWHIEHVSCGWGYNLRPGEIGKTMALMVRASDRSSFVTDLPWLRFWKRVGREPNPGKYERQHPPT